MTASAGLLTIDIVWCCQCSDDVMCRCFAAWHACFQHWFTWRTAHLSTHIGHDWTWCLVKHCTTGLGSMRVTFGVVWQLLALFPSHPATLRRSTRQWVKWCASSTTDHADNNNDISGPFSSTDTAWQFCYLFFCYDAALTFTNSFLLHAVLLHCSVHASVSNN